MVGYNDSYANAHTHIHPSHTSPYTHTRTHIPHMYFPDIQSARQSLDIATPLQFYHGINILHKDHIKFKNIKLKLLTENVAVVLHIHCILIHLSICNLLPKNPDREA